MQAGFRTHIGQRDSNQDNGLMDLERGLFAVADGVGGGQLGEEASASVCLVLERSTQQGQPLIQGILNAHEALRETTRNEGGRQYSATTIAALQLKGEEANICWVGDSRVYLVRDGRLLQMTEDHALEGEQHVLTQAVGAPLGKPMEAGTHCYKRQEGDIWLLCSDGFYNLLPDQDLLDILSLENAADDLAARLMQTALENGPDDNLTLLVVRDSVNSPENAEVLELFGDHQGAEADEPKPMARWAVVAMVFALIFTALILSQWSGGK